MYHVSRYILIVCKASIIPVFSIDVPIISNIILPDSLFIFSDSISYTRFTQNESLPIHLEDPFTDHLNSIGVIYVPTNGMSHFYLRKFVSAYIWV